MSNPNAFIVLDAPAALDHLAIFEELCAKYPGQPISSPTPDGDGETNAVLLGFAGKTLAIIVIDTPLPDEWQQAATRAHSYWPEAEDVFGRHKAHIIVSILGESEDRLQAARIITAVVGAVVTTHPASSGLLWDMEVANSSAIAAEQSSWAFASYPNFPAGLWVVMCPFRDESRVGIVTAGLENFIGREVELDADASRFEDVLSTAQSLLAYLLQDGVKLRNGDTIGKSATERVPVQVRKSRRFKGLPVISISLADDNHPATLPGN